MPYLLNYLQLLKLLVPAHDVLVERVLLVVVRVVRLRAVAVVERVVAGVAAVRAARLRRGDEVAGELLDLLGVLRDVAVEHALERLVVELLARDLLEVVVELLLDELAVDVDGHHVRARGAVARELLTVVQVLDAVHERHDEEHELLGLRLRLLARLQNLHAQELVVVEHARVLHDERVEVVLQLAVAVAQIVEVVLQVAHVLVLLRVLVLLVEERLVALDEAQQIPV